jgi:hypothetical protein
VFNPISPTCPHTTRAQLARSLGTLFATYLCTPYFLRLGAFAISPYPGVDGFPVLRLLCPIRLLMKSLEFRWALACLLPTLLSILHEVSRVPTVGLKQDDLGGVFLGTPSALCGSSVIM